MAIKRKATASRAKAGKSKKKTAGAPARKAAARKPRPTTRGTKGAAPKAAARKPAARPGKPAKPAGPVKPAPAAKLSSAARAGKSGPAGKASPAASPGKSALAVKPSAATKPGKSGKTASRLKVVARSAPPVVRPIGALPPEAVARAVKSAPPLAVRPGKPVPRPPREATPEQGAQGVSDQDFKEFEQRLLDERQKILKEMGHLESTVLKVNPRDSAGDLSGYSFHMADVGTDAMEREKAFLFASNEGQLLQEIDHALRKVYGGEFGACENCGRPITRARLEAMPYARLCMACKEAEERSNRGAT